MKVRCSKLLFIALVCFEKKKRIIDIDTVTLVRKDTDNNNNFERILIMLFNVFFKLDITFFHKI